MRVDCMAARRGADDDVEARRLDVSGADIVWRVDVRVASLLVRRPHIVVSSLVVDGWAMEDWSGGSNERRSGRSGDVDGLSWLTWA